MRKGTGVRRWQLLLHGSFCSRLTKVKLSMDISLLSTFLCRCVSVIHRMSSEWCSTSAIMSSIFPRSALTFKVPINISAGAGRVFHKILPGGS